MSARPGLREAGFTLIELLVTLTLMTIVFVIVVSMMMGGVRVWEGVKCGIQQDHDVYLALDKIRRGLHKAHPFEGSLFKGSNDKMEFPAILSRLDEKTDQTVREIGKIYLYFDRSRNRLCQSEQLYRGSRRRNYGQDLCVALAENIDRVNFRYNVYNTGAKSSSWSGYWSDKQFPLAVKMELDYHDPCSEKKSKKEFLVAIPIGPIG